LLLQNDDYHRRILAVTFTNKATEEMKSRIVRDLHKLANRKDMRYFRDMAEATKIDENDLPDIASKTLAHLLHDYSRFSVVTIDSFFQKVIRSFAREMGLYAGYNVELDQNSVLDQSTDLMLNDIDENDFLKDWLVEWAKRKIEDGKSWNVKSDVLRLGSEIFSEELQNIDPVLLRETTDKESLERFRVNLQQLVNKYWDYLQVCGRKALSVMDDYGLDVDSFFQKVIRSFAREMGLYAGYDVELDQNSVLDEAINLMLNDIDKNIFLKDWLVEWAKRKIEEGKSWDFKSDMLQLGNEIFSEELQNIDPVLLLETTDKESL